MEDILAILRNASHRLNLSTFLYKLHLVGLYICGIFCAAIILGKGIPFIRDIFDIRWFVPALVMVGLAAVFSLWMRQRPTLVHVAIEVDGRLDLHEKLSTALLCRSQQDGFSQAAIDDAVQTARSNQTKERVSRYFKVNAPENWWISPLLIIAACLALYLLPNGNLFASDKPKWTEQQQQELLAMQNQVDAAVINIAQDLGKDKEELKKMLEEMTSKEANPDPKSKTPEQAKIQEFKKLNLLREEMKKAADTQENRKLEQLSNKLSQLQSKDQGAAGDLARALANSDFKAAQKALDDLKKQLAQGELTEEQKKALEDMAKQLSKMAANNQAMASQLQQAGIDPALAANPAALQQAIQNAQNLTDEQKQKLAQMAQAMQQASQACQNMSNSMQAMCNNPGMTGAQGMGQQLSAMEMAMANMQSMNAKLANLDGMCNGMGEGMGMCQGQNGMGQGMGLQSWMMGQGSGMGNPGQGRGGYGTRLPVTANPQDIKAAVNTQQGMIIGEQVVEGTMIIPGNAQESFTKVVKTAGDRAKKSLDDNTTPAIYKDSIQHYYGELQAKTEIVASQQSSDEGTSESSTESSEAAETENSSDDDGN